MSDCVGLFCDVCAFSTAGTKKIGKILKKRRRRRALCFLGPTFDPLSRGVAKQTKEERRWLCRNLGQVWPKLGSLSLSLSRRRRRFFDKTYARVDNRARAISDAIETQNGALSAASAASGEESRGCGTWPGTWSTCCSTTSITRSGNVASPPSRSARFFDSGAVFLGLFSRGAVWRGGRETDDCHWSVAAEPRAGPANGHWPPSPISPLVVDRLFIGRRIYFRTRCRDTAATRNIVTHKVIDRSLCLLPGTHKMVGGASVRPRGCGLLSRSVPFFLLSSLFPTFHVIFI